MAAETAAIGSEERRAAEPAAAGGLRAPVPGRCGYFVERKKRFCKMIPAQGRRFCGEHGHQEEENDRKRIPCPLDPKHTVYEDQLQKHLKKCNSREKPKPAYFVQDINAGLKDATEILDEQLPISSLSKEELEDLIKKLKKASNGIKPILKDQMLSHQALQEALNDPKNGESAFKHLKQQASILGNMEKLHLLGPGRCFIEFGAGRGKLSHWVDIALQDAENVHFLLVERATTRFKVDGKHRKRDYIFERLQVDIQHLCLNKVPILEKEKLPVVGIGKHLCGAATDLALRCLVESYATQYDERNEEPSPKRFKSDKTDIAFNNSADERSGKNVSENWKPVAGIVIALCCHHRCQWKHYVGREFFRTVGLGPVEFNYFQRMTSWATCGMRETITEASTVDAKSKDQSSDTEEHDQVHNRMECSSDSLQGLLTVEERKQIGRLCKLLIDQGRIKYLQQRGYTAALQYYTDSTVSLENVLLTAVPSQSSVPQPTA
ncbi:tRNA:m(4)X modification enzyme TRM13 homolog isoform X2 [Trachemys scripta elegans]|uniref:tRNA:m(4)X modification enzyme TRM13 homolog isoform X2 n=1 Tax=Trachemys scripta elegans TaxID=31138 RepID=UPI001553A6D1|nr:tRNA:m(4)X modification enzyme TRM13 homolog isoform X2 [Trachemys scripta elegans]